MSAALATDLRAADAAIARGDVTPLSEIGDATAGQSEAGIGAAAKVLAMQDRAGEDRWAQQPAEVRDAYLDLARRALAAYLAPQTESITSADRREGLM